MANMVWCLATKLSKEYPEEIDCRQELAKIRTRWCKEHKDLDRFRPPERNNLRHVWLFVLPLGSIDDRDVYRVFWRGPCPPLYSLWEQGYMESPSRTLIDSYSNWIG